MNQKLFLLFIAGRRFYISNVFKAFGKFLIYFLDHLMIDHQFHFQIFDSLAVFGIFQCSPKKLVACQFNIDIKVSVGGKVLGCPNPGISLCIPGHFWEKILKIGKQLPGLFEMAVQHPQGHGNGNRWFGRIRSI